jgi:hypothetical protein
VETINKDKGKGAKEREWREKYRVETYKDLYTLGTY